MRLTASSSSSTAWRLFTDERPIEREPVNIHRVFEHVKRLAQSGFGRHIKFIEEYDPSLPPVLANRDQLIQVFLNLVKNAAESIGEGAADGEIHLTTRVPPRRAAVAAGQQGARVAAIGVLHQGQRTRVFRMIVGAPFRAIRHKPSPPDPAWAFALVAKIIGDHGGIIECESNHVRRSFAFSCPCTWVSTPGPDGAA